VTRALVLDAGSSWAAYQVGALGKIVRDQDDAFDLYAGTGIGAMNAAFVACGALGALEDLWDGIGLRALVRPSLRRPWVGPLDGAPQRRAIAAHVSEDALAARGARLLVSTLDLRAGEQRVLEYPGCHIGLVDGLMAAVATPGLVAPMRHGDALLAEGTLVETLLLDEVLRRAPDHVLVVASAGPGGGPRRRYATWRAVADRALVLNLGHDLDRALQTHRVNGRVRRAHDEAREALLAGIDAHVGDTALAARLREAIAAAHATAAVPDVRTIAPSRELGYPLWRFPRRRLREARTLGRADAEAVLGGRA
jgi:predicted acylesterase/phospholipase RssA